VIRVSSSAPTRAAVSRHGGSVTETTTVETCRTSRTVASCQVHEQSITAAVWRRRVAYEETATRNV